MLRCGYCNETCESYEDWLSHLQTDLHQANVGVNEIFTDHNKDKERNERSLVVSRINPKLHPYDVICEFARLEPLSFIKDVYVHIFPHVPEKFYLIVFDQKKFVDRFVRIGEQYGELKMLSSMVKVESKNEYVDSTWNSKIEASFFWRRHESLRRKICEISWSEQMKRFLNQVCLAKSDYEFRGTIIEELESLIREELHDAIVHPFGSCSTWLADVNADLDIYVDGLGDGGCDSKSSDSKLAILSKVCRLLRKKFDYKNVVSIKNCRVPIIKLAHPSGVKIDISFENCLSVVNSKMIQTLIKYDYRIRYLLVFLRYWARFHNLVGPQAVKSYALILMTFVFLRKQKLIPSVYELQNVEGTKGKSVCDWNVGYCINRDCARSQYPWLRGQHIASEEDDLGQEVMKLAYGFFSEYANFDYSTNVICPLLGDHISKELFESERGFKLPNEMELYKANLATSLCKTFPYDKILCVQDPFTLNVNVTSSCVKPEVIHQLKSACSMAAEALKPYASTYDSCGTVSILDLCCQRVPEIRKHEEVDRTIAQNIKQEVDRPTENIDNEDVEFNDLESWDAATPDKIYTGMSSTRNSYSHRDPRDTKPVRIPRVSIFDEDEGNNFEENYQKDEENSVGKSLKSVVVVPNGNGAHPRTNSRSRKSSRSKEIESKPATATATIKNENMDFVTDSNGSPTATPVVKFLPTPKTAPVVKFVHSDTPPPSLLGIKREYDEVDEAEEPNADSQQENLATNNNNSANNYGYENTVVQQPKVLTKTSKPMKSSVYVPPNLRNEASQDINGGESSSEIPQAPLIAARPRPDFPRFKISIGTEFVSLYEALMQPLGTIFAGVGTKLKMKIIWANYIYACFEANNFWTKISHIFSECEVQRIDEAWVVKTIFDQLELMKKHVAEMENGPVDLNNRKRSAASGSGNSSEGSGGESDHVSSQSDYQNLTSKLMRTSTCSDVSSRVSGELANYSNEDKQELLKKLLKLPTNVRKRSAFLISFNCYLLPLLSLHARWQKYSSQYKAQSISQCPLDHLGKIGTQVKSAINMPLESTDTEISITMVIAHDTVAPIPCTYFGYQRPLPPDHPDFNEQEQVQQILEGIINDIATMYVNYKLRKKFCKA